MNMLREIVIILAALAISIGAGYFIWSFIESIRLDLYCKEMREGFDCYQEGWVTFPAWLFSLVGCFISILSISIVAAISITSRTRSSKITLVIVAVLAIPLTMMISSPFAFLVTVLAGLITLLAAQKRNKKAARFRGTLA